MCFTKMCLTKMCLTKMCLTKVCLTKMCFTKSVSHKKCVSQKVCLTKSVSHKKTDTQNKKSNLCHFQDRCWLFYPGASVLTVSGQMSAFHFSFLSGHFYRDLTFFPDDPGRPLPGNDHRPAFHLFHSSTVVLKKSRIRMIMKTANPMMMAERSQI